MRLMLRISISAKEFFFFAKTNYCKMKRMNFLFSWLMVHEIIIFWIQTLWIKRQVYVPGVWQNLMFLFIGCFIRIVLFPNFWTTSTLVKFETKITDWNYRYSSYVFRFSSLLHDYSLLLLSCLISLNIHLVF